jgi:hypothetical protein
MAEQKEHATLMDVLNKIVLAGAVVGVLYGAGTWVYDMTSLVATKEYHAQDRDAMLEKIDKELIAPVRKSAENTEAGTIVGRIQNILDLKCRTQIPIEVENILQAQIARYKELMGRDFNVGGCRDGKRVTSYEMTNPPVVEEPEQ